MSQRGLGGFPHERLANPKGETEMQNNAFEDASLLASQADKLYVEAENLMSLISELEDG